MLVIAIVSFVTATANYVGENYLPFQTCINSGTNYYRTFDGLEYLFGGTCTYTLIQTNTWHITVEHINCNTYDTCKKVTYRLVF